MPASPVAKVLIVDDDARNRMALEALLEDLRQPLVVASSGEEALGKTLKDDFAVILLDVLMPGMDGFETAKLIRERRQSRPHPDHLPHRRLGRSPLDVPRLRGRRGGLHREAGESRGPQVQDRGLHRSLREEPGPRKRDRRAQAGGGAVARDPGKPAGAHHPPAVGAGKGAGAHRARDPRRAGAGADRAQDGPDVAHEPVAGAEAPHEQGEIDVEADRQHHPLGAPHRLGAATRSARRRGPVRRDQLAGAGVSEALRRSLHDTAAPGGCRSPTRSGRPPCSGFSRRSLPTWRDTRTLPASRSRSG